MESLRKHNFDIELHDLDQHIVEHSGSAQRSAEGFTVPSKDMASVTENTMPNTKPSVFAAESFTQTVPKSNVVNQSQADCNRDRRTELEAQADAKSCGTINSNLHAIEPSEIAGRRRDSSSTSERNRERLRVTFSDQCVDVTTPLTSPPSNVSGRTSFDEKMNNRKRTSIGGEWQRRDSEPTAENTFDTYDQNGGLIQVKQENGFKYPAPPVISSNATKLVAGSANLSVADASMLATSDSEEDAEELARMRQKFCPEPGKKYLVHMRSGEQHVAELLSKRVRHANSCDSNGTAASTNAVTIDGKNTADIGSTDNNNVEYFVHFEGFNRRLDEWVTIDRIHPRELDQNQLIAKADENDARKRTRSQKRRHDEINHIAPTLAEIDPSQAALEKLHEEVTKIKYIDKIVFGPYEIDTWYYSPYPGEYRQSSILYICEYCMKYIKSRSTWEQHKRECIYRQPPGREIYRKGQLSVYEADGARHKVYCQCLCLLAKLFLDHKTLYFDVEPFWFYILTECDQQGAHVVGYFSKEKESADGNNVACILTFPPFQRKGYGKFLIDLSYELSRREQKIGSPEKPLSDMGKLSYRSYWAYSILCYLKNIKDRDLSNLSIRDLSNEIGFHCGDIINTLQPLNLVRYWRSHYVLTCKHDVICEYLEKSSFRPPRLEVDKSYLRWMPHLPVAPRPIERIAMLKAALGEQQLLDLMNHLTLLKTGVAPPIVVSAANSGSSPKLSPSALMASPPQTQQNGSENSIAATANIVMRQLQRRTSSQALDKALMIVFETWQQACENVRRSREMNGSSMLYSQQLGLGPAQPEADLYGCNGKAGAENEGGSVDGSITSSSGGSESTNNSSGYNPHHHSGGGKPAGAGFINTNFNAAAAHTSTLAQTAADTLAATRSRRTLKPSAVVRDNAAASIGRSPATSNRGRSGGKPMHMSSSLQQSRRKRSRNISNDSMGSSQGFSDEELAGARDADEEMPGVKDEEDAAVSYGGKEGVKLHDEEENVEDDVVSSSSLSSNSEVDDDDDDDDDDHASDHDFDLDVVSEPTTKHTKVPAEGQKDLDTGASKSEKGNRKVSPRRSSRLVSTSEADEAAESRALVAPAGHTAPASPAATMYEESDDLSTAVDSPGVENKDAVETIERRNSRHTVVRLKSGKFASLKTAQGGTFAEKSRSSSAKRSCASSGTEVENEAAASMTSSASKSGRKKSKHFADDALVVQRSSNYNEAAAPDEVPRKRVVRLLSKPRATAPPAGVERPVVVDAFLGSVFEDLNSPPSTSNVSKLPPLSSISQIIDNSNNLSADDDNWNQIISATTAATSRSNTVAPPSTISSRNDDDPFASKKPSSSAYAVQVAATMPTTRTVTITDPNVNWTAAAFSFNTALSSSAASSSASSSGITRSSLRRGSIRSGTQDLNDVAPTATKAVKIGKKAANISSKRDAKPTMLTRNLRSTQQPATETTVKPNDEGSNDATEQTNSRTLRRRKLLAAADTTPHTEKARSAALSAHASSTDLSADDGDAATGSTVSDNSGKRKYKHVTLINPDALESSQKSPASSSSAVLSPSASGNFAVFSPSSAIVTKKTSSFFAADHDPFVIADDDAMNDDERHRIATDDSTAVLPVLYAADAEIGGASASDTVASQWPTTFNAGSPPIIVANREADYITMPQIFAGGSGRVGVSSTFYHDRGSLNGTDVGHVLHDKSRGVLLTILGGEEEDELAGNEHIHSLYASGSTFASSSADDLGESPLTFMPTTPVRKNSVGRPSNPNGSKKKKAKQNGGKSDSAEKRAEGKKYRMSDELREQKCERAKSMIRNAQGKFVKTDSTTTSSANSESSVPPAVLSALGHTSAGSISGSIGDDGSFGAPGEPIGLGGIRKHRGMTPASLSTPGGKQTKSQPASSKKSAAAKASGRKSCVSNSSAAGGRRAPSSTRRSGGSERDSMRSSPSPPSVTDQLTIERLNAVDAVAASRPRERPMRASAKEALLSFVTRDV